MGSTSLVNSLPASIFPLTLNMTKLHKNSSMATRICALPTLTNLPSLLTRSSYHVNEEVGYLTTSSQVPVKVVEAGGTRGNNWVVPQNPLSAMTSTEQLGASSWTVNSAINAPAAPQAATLKPTAHTKQGREHMSEFELRGKRPCYMHFIFGIRDISHMPLGTYTKSAPAVPDVPPSDY